MFLLIAVGSVEMVLILSTEVLIFHVGVSIIKIGILNLKKFFEDNFSIRDKRES